MYQNERITAIMQVLKQNGYMTVKALRGELHYSNATINRDLNVMEKQELVRRSYGGVELIDKSMLAPVPYRYHKMKAVKNKLSQKAAEFVQDGDCIFIDGTTTTEYMGRYLLHKKDITVITNNVALVMYLGEYGVKVICLGGQVIDAPCMLNGEETIENASLYRVDKMFFTTYSMSSDGQIGDNDLFYHLRRVMQKNAKQCFYLADHEKIDKPYNRIFTLSEGDYIITDYAFEESVKAKYKGIHFIEVPHDVQVSK